MVWRACQKQHAMEMCCLNCPAPSLSSTAAVHCAPVKCLSLLVVFAVCPRSFTAIAHMAAHCPRSLPFLTAPLAHRPSCWLRSSWDWRPALRWIQRQGRRRCDRRSRRSCRRSRRLANVRPSCMRNMLAVAAAVVVVAAVVAAAMAGAAAVRLAFCVSSLQREHTCPQWSCSSLTVPRELLRRGRWEKAEAPRSVRQRQPGGGGGEGGRRRSHGTGRAPGAVARLRACDHREGRIGHDQHPRAGARRAAACGGRRGLGPASGARSGGADTSAEG